LWTAILLPTNTPNSNTKQHTATQVKPLQSMENKDKSAEFLVMCAVVTCIGSSLYIGLIALPKQQQQHDDNIRLQTQLEMTQKQLEESKLVLSGKREK
jgi:hypothetical protein